MTAYTEAPSQLEATRKHRKSILYILFFTLVLDLVCYSLPTNTTMYLDIIIALVHLNPTTLPPPSRLLPLPTKFQYPRFDIWLLELFQGLISPPDLVSLRRSPTRRRPRLPFLPSPGYRIPNHWYT